MSSSKLQQYGSVENTQRRHCGVSLKHDRTGGTENDLSDTGDGRRDGKTHDGTDKHSSAKLWKTDTNPYLLP